MLKVSKLRLSTSRFLPCACRRLSGSCAGQKPLWAHLHNRSLLRVWGKDSGTLLQGLITNDIRLLDDGRHTIFAMYLNPQGRCLYDALIYRLSKQSSDYFVEVSSEHAKDALSHMRRYKLRSKVEFEDLTDTYNVYAAFVNSTSTVGSSPFLNDISVPQMQTAILDPRLPRLGSRILSMGTLSTPDGFDFVSIDTYRRFRYELGICEGPEEYENGMPLEYNMALLNGVSFDKGCYIGQELIARAHHTGVIRKRVMPITFTSSNGSADAPVAAGTAIWSPSKKKRIGKLICYCGDRGLAMMRLAETLNEPGPFVIETENNETLHVDVQKPTWWPSDMLY